METLSGTPIHPIWSEDRQDWVPLGELEAGETLQGSDGPATVLSVTIVNKPVPVYNIEIHGQHVYQVGELGVVVHNACLDNIAKISDDALVNFGSSVRSVVHPPLGRSYWFRWGDIKHLTPSQVRTVIGDLAHSGTEGGNRFVRVAADVAHMVRQPPNNGAGILEYVSDVAVKVSKTYRIW